MIAIPDISSIAALIAEPARASMLMALLDGRALPASELAQQAWVSPQTASSHLAKLMEGRLLVVERHGRHRYYRLATWEVGQLIESLLAFAPSPPQPRQMQMSVDVKAMRLARTCYDHLAGKVGVELAYSLIEKGIIKLSGVYYRVTRQGSKWFDEFGIDIKAAERKRRVFAKQCFDWSERRDHIAGALGAAILIHLFELGWIARVKGSRTVRITHIGQEMFYKVFNIELSN
ncbi:MAG: winged helix-turn-helix domain-containing protein [Acidobacteriota bacterium]